MSALRVGDKVRVKWESDSNWYLAQIIRTSPSLDIKWDAGGAVLLAVGRDCVRDDRTEVVMEQFLLDLIDDILIEAAFDIHLQAKIRHVKLEAPYNLYSCPSTSDLSYSLAKLKERKSELQGPLLTDKQAATADTSKLLVTCPHCRVGVGALRFAHHLEKCMSATTVASIVNSSSSSSSCSSGGGGLLNSYNWNGTSNSSTAHSSSGGGGITIKRALASLFDNPRPAVKKQSLPPTVEDFPLIDPHPHSCILRIKLRNGLPTVKQKRIGATMEQFLAAGSASVSGSSFISMGNVHAAADKGGISESFMDS
jgi:hypothetical protein